MKSSKLDETAAYWAAGLKWEEREGEAAARVWARKRARIKITRED